MTDAEIIKALECCAGDDGCDVCPMYKPSSECITELQGKALDLINRQKAEIERLKRLLEEEEAKYKECAKRFYKEAIKEFAERLKDKQQTFISDEYAYKFIYLIEIDNLAKEMVGDTE